ncbi:hypothetical protein HXX25_04275 [Hyphobacterium sp. CCMP332]|uniref:hypothetical protein n=1 Tax=Hyphobacterium sp. CCMP332 TaxID=2749086 RepID=UPI00164F9D44|nr:hypothetical protein [Hyphobacterium sp. CCMP332]QNL18628.1 hypothetical protein HXX25_04275 [Hyphobacterium sp. CCMP332]
MTTKPSTKLKYYRLRRNRAFFEPGPVRAKSAGWFRHDGTPKSTIPLGLAGDNAEQEALRLYHLLCRDLGKTVPKDAPERPRYPIGSFGHFVTEWKKSDVWADMAPRTREDYDRAWPKIEKRFAHTPILNITAAKSASFHREMKLLEQSGQLSPSMRFRILKVWRSLLSQAEAIGVFTKAPIGRISNSQAKGSSAYWFADEIDLLISAAADNGYHGMALAIQIGWETLLSPCDVRCLSKSRLKLMQAGDGYVDTNRLKTGKQALPFVSCNLMSAISEYIGSLDVELGDEEPIIRMQSGAPFKNKDTFAKDFRKVRSLVFTGDKRTFKDIRRSGNLEADLGGASAEDRAELLANSLHKNGFLEATYTPPTVARGMKIRDNRASGRNLLKAEKEAKSRNNDEK